MRLIGPDVFGYETRDVCAREKFLESRRRYKAAASKAPHIRLYKRARTQRGGAFSALHLGKPF